MLAAMRALMVIVLTGLLALTAAAEVYKWTDEDGNIIYSDEPHPGAEVLDPQEVQTIDLPDPGPPPRLGERGRPTPERKAPSYESIAITSPADEATKIGRAHV